MKSLKIIQTASKLSKVFSKIIYICSIVGICGCVISVPTLFFGDEILKIGGMTIHGIFESSGTSLGTVVSAIVVGIIACTMELVLSGKAHRYFSDELEAGTPFTADGADSLMKLGISSIWMPVVASILARTFSEIIAMFYEDAVLASVDFGDNITVGIAIVLISIIVRCASEQISEKAEKADD